MGTTTHLSDRIKGRLERQVAAREKEFAESFSDERKKKKRRRKPKGDAPPFIRSPLGPVHWVNPTNGAWRPPEEVAVRAQRQGATVCDYLEYVRNVNDGFLPEPSNWGRSEGKEERCASGGHLKTQKCDCAQMMKQGRLVFDPPAFNKQVHGAPVVPQGNLAAYIGGMRKRTGDQPAKWCVVHGRCQRCHQPTNFGKLHRIEIKAEIPVCFVPTSTSY